MLHQCDDEKKAEDKAKAQEIKRSDIYMQFLNCFPFAFIKKLIPDIDFKLLKLKIAFKKWRQNNARCRGI